MDDYRYGYEYYKQACKKYGLEPINYHYFVLKLCEDQLQLFNAYARAKLKGGTNDFTVV